MVPVFVYGKLMAPFPKLLGSIFDDRIKISAFVAARLWFQFWQYYPSTDSKDFSLDCPW
jgi:hypothetical protein